MKYLKIPLIFFCFLVACSTSDSETEKNDLKIEIIDLQNDIRIISNKLEGLDLQGLSFTDELYSENINHFREKREIQKEKIITLDIEFNEKMDIENVICADFEDLDCFIENWEISKNENSTLKISNDCSYNGSSSLQIYVPFDENAYNVPGLEIEGYINGIEASTIYNIRYWAKYNGTCDKSNGPLTHMIIMQDGEYLDYLYEGAGHKPNVYKDKDWKLYSFQIATITSSPLEIIFGTNIENVCIDDIHIIKKKE